MKFDPLIWRPVLAGLDGLYNVQVKWTLEDLADAHDALDFKAEMERRAFKNAGGDGD